MAKRSKEARTVPRQGTWESILAEVKRPIALFALTLLITESVVLGITASDTQSNGALVLVGVVVVLVICVVAALTKWAPDALFGREWLEESLADSLAEAAVAGLEGSVTNLPTSDDQSTAWALLMLWVERRRKKEGEAARQFRTFVVSGIHFRVRKKWPDLKDRIEELLKEGRKPDR
jgi:uncharacterized protein (DUF58 family)